MRSKKKVLVLGANGFIGAHVVRALLDAGHGVRVYERRLSQHLPPEVEMRLGMLEDLASLTEAARGIETVLYLSWAGYPATTKANFALDLHANLLTAVSVMEVCRSASARLIFASSGGTVYGAPQQLPIPETHPTQPICAHGLGKLIAEQYLAVYRHRGELASIVLRPANAFGPGQWPDRKQGFVATLLGRLARGLPVDVWGDGSVVRDYVFVDDVAKAFVRAVEYEKPQTVFNIGSGTGHSIREVLAAVEAVTGRKVSANFLPGSANDVPVNVLDIGSATRELNWRPEVSFETGLAATWKWISTEWLAQQPPAV